MTKEEARKILNLGILASDAEIKNAFRQAAKKYHPDSSQNNGEYDQLFIRAHEAYEILSGKRKASQEKSFNPKASGGNKETRFRNPGYYKNNDFQHSEYSNLNFEERMRKARQSAEDIENQRSRKIYQDLFEEYLNGWKHKALKYSVAISLLFVCLFTFDHFYPLQKSLLSTDEYAVYKVTPEFGSEYVLVIRNTSFNIDKEDYDKLLNSDFVLESCNTLITKDIRGLSIEDGFEINFSPTFKIFNIHYLFYLHILILLLPLFFYLNEKPSFNFLFFGMYGSIYAIPVFIMLILFSEGRIYRIFDIL